MADEDSSSSGSDFDLNEDEEEIDEPVPESWLGYSWYVVKKAGRKTHKGEKQVVFILYKFKLSSKGAAFGLSTSLSSSLSLLFLNSQLLHMSVAAFRLYSFSLLLLNFTAIVYVGEKLAWYLGITSPDWQYAIDIHEDMEREAKEEREAEERALKKQQEEVLKAMAQMEDANTDAENRTNSD